MTYPTLSVNLRVPDPAVAIEFYAAAFGAKERCRLINPKTNSIGHAELTFDAALLSLSPGGPSPHPAIQILLNCADVEAASARATKAGAVVIRPLRTEFHGHRCGLIRDPFGHEWMLFEDLENFSAQEMQSRWTASNLGETPA